MSSGEFREVTRIDGVFRRRGSRRGSPVNPKPSTPRLSPPTNNTRYLPPSALAHPAPPAPAPATRGRPPGARRAGLDLERDGKREERDRLAFEDDAVALDGARDVRGIDAPRRAHRVERNAHRRPAGLHDQRGQGGQRDRDAEF